MNKRIKELAEQAGVDSGQLFAEMLCNDSEVNVKIAEEWNNQPHEVRERIFQLIWQNQEKFAELIVEECASVLTDEMDRLDKIAGREVSAQTMDTARFLIKNHFGV